MQTKLIHEGTYKTIAVGEEGIHRCKRCGEVIGDETSSRRYCATCLQQNIHESKRRYEITRRRSSLSEPKRNSITKNRKLQIMIRTMEPIFAKEHGYSNLSSFNRWANTEGKAEYDVFAKNCIDSYIKKYFSPEMGNPIMRMTNLTIVVPEIRMAFIMEYMKRQKENGFNTMEEYQAFEYSHLQEAAEWRVELVCKIIENNLHLLNNVNFDESDSKKKITLC